MNDRGFLIKTKSYLNAWKIDLDKTLKGIRGVRLDNLKALCAPGLRTKNFKRLFL